MARERVLAFAWSIGIVAALAIACSFLWHIPYIYTAIASVSLSIIGVLITLDEDLPGGWSPDPADPRAIYVRFTAIFSVLAILIVVAVLFPAVRAAGGR